MLYISFQTDSLSGNWTYPKPVGSLKKGEWSTVGGCYAVIEAPVSAEAADIIQRYDYDIAKGLTCRACVYRETHGSYGTSIQKALCSSCKQERKEGIGI